MQEPKGHKERGRWNHTSLFILDRGWDNQENGEKEGFRGPASLHCKNTFLHTDVYAGRPHTDPAHVDVVHIADMTQACAHLHGQVWRSLIPIQQLQWQLRTWTEQKSFTTGQDWKWNEERSLCALCLVWTLGVFFLWWRGVNFWECHTCIIQEIKS